MLKKYLLGLDNGGTVIKGALFDRSGAQIACEHISIPIETPLEGFCERDMKAIKEANETVIRRLCDVYGGDSIAAVGISGHGKGLYLLDRLGEVFTPGIPSADRRALSIVQEWEKDGTADAVYPLTAQKIMACQPVALLRWLKENMPTVYGNIGAILSVKDYVRYCLTGQVYAEYTDMSGTNLMDLHTKNYSSELLNAFGINEIAEYLPPIKESSAVCGSVLPEVEANTGLATGTPVVGGMFDIDACALASGCTKPGEMSIVAGTWSINQYITEQPVEDGSVSMNSLFCTPGYYLAEESSAASAGTLEWFRKQWAIFDYGELDSAASSVSPEESNLYYLPFLYASNQAPQARCCLVGMSGHHTFGHVVRAVYEGVVFSHMTHINALLSCLDKPEVVRLSGGVVQSKIWTQIFADIIGLPMEAVRDIEMGAMGAAMAAGVGIGWFDSYEEVANAWVHPGEVIYPDATRHAVYTEKYKRYLKVAEALNPIWKDI